ncbi:MAG: hypothetical protein ACI92S_005312, partial [Planctomycetaceae bacterium]
MKRTRYCILILIVSLHATAIVAETKAPSSSTCIGASGFYNAWIKVGERTCLKCHNAEGDAADSDFLLRDVSTTPAAQRASVLVQNCEAFTRMASKKTADGKSRLLTKATGGLDHGGGEVLKLDSTAFRVLNDFVESLSRKPGTTPTNRNLAADDDLSSFFDGVEMISDQRLLRRITLSLAARLPSEDEQRLIKAGGLKALQPILAELMRDDAFYERLLEGFNDIFLTLGYNGNGEEVLSYDHFQHTRLWYQKHSLDHIPEKERQRARYKLADQYRDAVRREPLELLRHIVSNDRPFTEILTADYTMVSPYTS